MADRNATGSALECYRCGASLAALSLPLSRLDLCPGCSVELHVCRMCRNYAPAAPDACTEEDAIEVTNKAVANFCDYFAPNPGAFDGREQRADDAARRQLAALFGEARAGADEEPTPPSAEKTRLEQAQDLFKK
jgi:hypothetical protein